MGEAAKKLRLYTRAEYETMLERADQPLEFLDGEILAMAGGTNFHNDIIQNITGYTWKTIRKSGCRINSENLRIEPPKEPGEIGAVFFPDIVIYCPDDPTARTLEAGNPVALFEVMSKSSQTHDRARKFERCARIRSLRHYVLVSQYEMRVEHRWRSAFGAEWQYRVLTEPDDRVTFAEVPFDLSLAEVYEDIPV